jgi:hypothetical protein
MQQHIKRKCSIAVFESVSNGDRCFDIRPGCNDTEDLAVDDFVTFVEVDNDRNPTGREIYRRISYVTRSKDFHSHKDGFTILGLVTPTFKRLQSALLDSCFILAFSLTHKGEDNEIANMATVPPLTVPDWLNLEQILEAINVPVWPDGIYSITLLMKPNTKDPTRQSIVDHLIMVKELDEDLQVLTELDVRHLFSGRLIDMEGRKITPTFEDTNGPENEELDPAEVDRIVAAGEHR